MIKARYTGVDNELLQSWYYSTMNAGKMES